MPPRARAVVRLAPIASIMDAPRHCPARLTMAAEPGTLNLQVDIVSDVVCPWCIIGYLQLRKALDSMDFTVDAELRWRPFERRNSFSQAKIS